MMGRLQGPEGACVKRVIVTADDFGLCPEVNRAVIQAHREGILTCTSLMVGAGAVAEAVSLAKAHPSLKVGLHLVLVDGSSVLPKRQIPDLVDDTGRFAGEAVASGTRYFFSKRVQRQIEGECEAQIEAFLATGLEMDHLNSHWHLHIHPSLCDILLPLVKRYRIPAVRLPWQGLRTLTRRQSITAGVMYPWVMRLRRKLKKNAIAHNKELFGLYETGSMDIQSWLRLIPKIRPGVTEIYCHPAARDTYFLQRSAPSYQHLAELAALLSPEVKAALAGENTRRICFANL
jgi:hopanoid biosynthesis associated protein HpnK